MTPAAASQLLEAFRKVPRQEPVRPTFMELSGYPHYENVYSNILAFFFDPASPHGLGSLCLDALLEAAHCRTAGSPLSNVVVEREVQTDSGKSLDILIDSDNIVLAIENKIFAGLYNPLSDYAYLVDKRGDGRRDTLKLVLSLVPPAPKPGHGFRSLLYKDFTAVLRSKLGHYARRAESRYLTYLLDFLDTIDDLQRGTQMDAAWLDFARDHHTEIQKLLNQVRMLKAEMRCKVQELRSMIKVAEMPSIRRQDLWREAEALYDCLFHEITVNPILRVIVDTVVQPERWEIRIFVRPWQTPPALRTLLDSLDILYSDNESHLTYPESLPYSASIKDVHFYLHPIIEKIANAKRLPQPEVGSVTNF